MEQAKKRSSIMGLLFWLLLVCLVTILLVVAQDDVRGVLRLAAITLLVVIGAILLSLYLGMPLVLRRTTWFATNPQMELFDPDVGVLPQEVVEESDALRVELEPVDFRVKARIHVVSGSNGGTQYITMLESGRNGEVALHIMSYSHGRLFKGKITDFFLITRFADDSEFLTTNNVLLVPYPRPSWREEIWLPHIRSAAELYAVHQSVVGTLAKPSVRWSQLPDPRDEWRNILKREFEFFASKGYLFHDERTNRYRMTWKGAFLCAWKQLVPTLHICRWLARRRTGARLKDAGIELTS
jgi:hypothetical protein